jgi:hypothetical protein
MKRAAREKIIRRKTKGAEERTPAREGGRRELLHPAGKLCRQFSVVPGLSSGTARLGKRRNQPPTLVLSKVLVKRKREERWGGVAVHIAAQRNAFHPPINGPTRMGKGRIDRPADGYPKAVSAILCAGRAGRQCWRCIICIIYACADAQVEPDARRDVHFEAVP